MFGLAMVIFGSAVVHAGTMLDDFGKVMVGAIAVIVGFLCIPKK